MRMVLTVADLFIYLFVHFAEVVKKKKKKAPVAQKKKQICLSLNSLHRVVEHC